jgi:hypothetical protein
MAVSAVSAEAIVVTGSRVRKVDLEDIGDLKLYRIPDPVTVAANSQKQVALLERPSVKVETIYRIYSGPGESEWSPAQRIVRTRNRTAEGLGLPLPAGRVVLFGTGRQRPILLGEGFVEDKAVGEDVEIVLGQAAGVFTRSSVTERAVGQDVELTVTNDSDHAAAFEAELDEGGGRISSASRLGRRNGRHLWSTVVPAGGTATLRYRFVTGS